MNKAKFMDCSACGSYTEDCEIISRRDFTDDDMNSIERQFGFNNGRPKFMYLIMLEDAAKPIWVSGAYIKLPDFAGPI